MEPCLQRSPGTSRKASVSTSATSSISCGSGCSFQCLPTNPFWRPYGTPWGWLVSTEQSMKRGRYSSSCVGMTGKYIFSIPWHSKRPELVPLSSRLLSHFLQLFAVPNVFRSHTCALEQAAHPAHKNPSCSSTQGDKTWTNVCKLFEGTSCTFSTLRGILYHQVFRYHHHSNAKIRPAT